MSADTVDFVAYCFEEHMVKANWTLPTGTFTVLHVG
jgi:hypothetical protein